MRSLRINSNILNYKLYILTLNSSASRSERAWLEYGQIKVYIEIPFVA